VVANDVLAVVIDNGIQVLIDFESTWFTQAEKVPKGSSTARLGCRASERFVSCTGASGGSPATCGRKTMPVAEDLRVYLCAPMCDERAAPSRRSLVDVPGDDFLAGAGLAL
jgi:hypothetical protein